MYYYIILALQAYCIYHAYTNKSETYWFFVIIFLPVIGSIVYLVTNVFNKNDYEKVQDGLTSVLNPTKKVKDLKKKLEFSETFQNKVNLADAYLEMNDYNNAVKYYEDAKKSLFSNDSYVTENLMEAYFQLKKHNKVIDCYNDLQESKDKTKAKSYTQYAITLDDLGKPKAAKKAFEIINKSFSNYEERYLYADFLIKKNEVENAKIILNEILEESNHFTKDNKRIHKKTIQKVNQLLKTSQN